MRVWKVSACQSGACRAHRTSAIHSATTAAVLLPAMGTAALVTTSLAARQLFRWFSAFCLPTFCKTTDVSSVEPLEATGKLHILLTSDSSGVFYIIIIT